MALDSKSSLTSQFDTADKNTESTTSHQKKSAATRKNKNPNAFKEMGRKGAIKRHSKSSTEESEIAKRAAATRKERDQNAFSKMGRSGGKAPHKSRGRSRRSESTTHSVDSPVASRNRDTNQRIHYNDSSANHRSLSSKDNSSTVMRSSHYRKDDE